MEPMLLALDTIVPFLVVSAKKTVKEKKADISNKIATELSVYHHKDNIMNFLKTDNLAGYLLGSKPLSLNAPSVC